MSYMPSMLSIPIMPSIPIVPFNGISAIKINEFSWNSLKLHTFTYNGSRGYRAHLRENSWSIHSCHSNHRLVFLLKWMSICPILSHHVRKQLDHLNTFFYSYGSFVFLFINWNQCVIQCWCILLEWRWQCVWIWIVLIDISFILKDDFARQLKWWAQRASVSSCRWIEVRLILTPHSHSNDAS